MLREFLGFWGSGLWCFQGCGPGFTIIMENQKNNQTENKMPADFLIGVVWIG